MKIQLEHIKMLDEILEQIRSEKMRTTFSITIKADILEGDDNARQAFTEILRDNSEVLYAQLAMLSRRPPTITVQIVDEEMGIVKLDLFNSTHVEDYSEG
jgi:hypothetical protein